MVVSFPKDTLLAIRLPLAYISIGLAVGAACSILILESVTGAFLLNKLIESPTYLCSKVILIIFLIIKDAIGSGIL